MAITKVGTPVYMTGCNYQLGYELLSQDSATNKSTVRLYGILTVTNNVISWSSGSASVHTSGLMAIAPSYNKGEYNVVYKDFEWEHDANGNFSVWIGASLSTTFVSGNTGGVITLPTIARKIITTNSFDFNDETNVVGAYFTNPNNCKSVPYINFYLGDQYETYSLRLTRSKALRTSPYAWLFTNEEKQQMRETLANYSSCNVSIGFESYDNDTDTLIGYSSVQRKFSIVNANPIFEQSYKDTNATTTAITQNDQQIIQNISTLQIKLTNVTALKGATIASAKVVLNGVTYNASSVGNTITFDIGVLNISTDTTATVSVTDSRGLTTTKTLSITFLEYYPPTGLISLARKNNYYSETDIKVDANYASLDSKNIVEIKVRSKKTTDADYGAYTTLQDNVTTTLTLDNLYEWEVQVVITDSVGGANYTNLTLDKGLPIVFFDRLKRSVGINSFPKNDNTLDILGGDLLNVLGTKVDTWESGENYTLGQIVSYNRTLYKNLTNVNSGTPDTDTTNWEETSILSNLLGTSKSYTYLTFGNIGICWGQVNPTYVNPNVLIGTATLPIAYGSGRCIASPVNYNNQGFELDAIAKVPSTVGGTSLSLALHSKSGAFTSSSTSFYINYIVIGTIL